jgi:hypothetical protein
LSFDFLQEQGIVFNQSYNEFKDNSNGIVLHNNISHEDRLVDKDIIIAQQKEIIALLREKIAGFEKK